MISEHLNWRKVGLYLVFAFGISWTSAPIAYASGIPVASVPGIVVLALTFSRSAPGRRSQFPPSRN